MRPQFHFTADTGWINDPHAITFRNGRFHLFYQYVPDSLEWAADVEWGHATGPDLFTWHSEPVAIKPGDGDDGIWTGSLATDRRGNAKIFYTAVERPNIAIGQVRTAGPRDSDWKAWEKGPVVVESPEDIDVTSFRDPFVFPDEDGWSMFVGAALADGNAAALVYSSTDLHRWTSRGVAARRSVTEHEPVWTGSLWECPQLIDIDGRHVLLFSVWDQDTLHSSAYAVGSYRDGRFVADSWGRLSYGPSYYAPSYFRDAEGRPTVTFWMRGVMDAEVGWAGAHSVPHMLSLEGDKLIATPHDGIAEFRRPAPAWNRVDRPAADAEWTPAGDERLTVAADGRILFAIERSGDELALTRETQRWAMPFVGGTVRILVDGPTVEVSTSEGIIATPIDGHDGSIDFVTSSPLVLWRLAR